MFQTSSDEEMVRPAVVDTWAVIDVLRALRLEESVLRGVTEHLLHRQSPSLQDVNHILQSIGLPLAVRQVILQQVDEGGGRGRRAGSMHTSAHLPGEARFGDRLLPAQRSVILSCTVSVFVLSSV